MTDEEMRERIKEIDKVRDELGDEKRKYEHYFYEKAKQDLAESHKKYVGKCYIAIDSLANEDEHIRAFKIIHVCVPPDEKYANCIALIDGYRYTGYREYGVQLMTLPLWYSNTRRMISSPYDPKMIDFYKEITNEEFWELYDKFESNVKNARFDRNTGE